MKNRDWVRGVAVGVPLTALVFAVDLAILRLVLGPVSLDPWWSETELFVGPAVVAVVLTIAAGVSESYAAAWLQRRGLSTTEATVAMTTSWLQRTRTWRAVGFVAPVLLGTLGTWLVGFSLSPTEPVRGTAVDLGSLGVTLGFVGYAVASLLVEVLRRSPRTTTQARQANLFRRDPDDYLLPVARWGPRVLVVAALVVSVLPRGDLGPSTFQIVGTAVTAWFAAELARRWVVGRRQPVLPPDLLVIDDGARSGAAQCISATAIAIIGVVLGGALGAGVGGAIGEPWSTVLGFGGILVGAFSLGVWLGYGTDVVPRIRRPQSPAPVDTGLAPA